MQDFQRSLLQDLRGRTVSLQERLTESLTDPDRRAHARDVDTSLRRVQQAIDGLLLDPNLSRPELNVQHRQMYQRLNENVMIVESYLIPPLERFNEHDRRMTRMVRKLGEQLNWPMGTPLVITDSAQYYVTFPSFQIMRIPAVEDDNMLAYPDLVHEMAHILMVKERQRLQGDFVTVASNYVVEQQTKFGVAAVPQNMFERWRGPWLDEFISDMVAVYTMGPAFGAQHTRLISGMRSSAYAFGQSHPPDEARVRATAAVLRAMGQSGDASAVEQMWADYAPTTGEIKPAEYDAMIPDYLVDALAKRVVAGSQQLNLRRYDAPSVSQPGDIVGMVTEGWNRFRSTPATFGNWQTARLRLLWQQLGLDGQGRSQTPVASKWAPGVVRPGPQLPLSGHELAA